MTPIEFRRLRKAARMTQAEMAAHLGKSRKTIVNWETGIFAIPDDALDTLTEKGVTPEHKEMPKEQRDRLAYDRHVAEVELLCYRSTRAFPEYNTHAKTLALFISQGRTFSSLGQQLILAEFPDILTSTTKGNDND